MRKSETTRQLLMASSAAAVLVGAIVLPTAPASAVLIVTPTITTQQQPAAATVGSSIADKATVTGGFNPTGTVTFQLWNNPNTFGLPLFISPAEPLMNGSATSPGFNTTATGTDYWVAIYSGDANNNSVVSGAAAEPVTINAISTVAAPEPAPRLPC